MNDNNLFFQLLRLSIGRRSSLSRTPSSVEWSSLYELSVMQAVAGVCFCGVQRLPNEQVVHLPKQLMMQWFVLAEQIKQRNRLLNARAKELTEKFAEGGFRSCVLKGQGIAEIYSDSDNDSDGGNLGLYRQSGDIDLWVDGERMEVLDFACSFGEVGSVDIKHADFKCFEDVEVEIHSVPSWFYNPIHNRKFRKWLVSVNDEQFVKGEQGFACPTIEFNVVYVLIHIYRHLFDEGVGLRQLMDYYFVLRNLNLYKNDNRDNWDNIVPNAIAKATFRSLGMERFVGAVMWIMHEVFGMERECLLCKPSEKYGRRLLDIVMAGGNFGRYDMRNRHGKENAIQRGFRNLMHNMQVVKDYPSEVLWAPFWKVGHFVWRKAKGFE